MNCLSIATGNGFFRLSPEDYKGLHQRYAATMQLAGKNDNDNEEKDEEKTRLETELASAFPLLMAWLWRQKDLKPEELKTEQVQQFIRTHAAVLDHAVDTAIKETPLDEISVQRLKESNYVFSGIKTFHELKEAFPSLVGADGNIKPFEQFLAEVRRVHKTYNRQYLQAEYHLAQSSASMAARWKKFEKDGDRYLLQYRTIGDKRVRPTHRYLHGITLPINSKFWDEYFPPNNWNCRCSVVQVRRSKYTQSDEAEAMRLGLKATAGKYREMFLFNPGKTMTCFPMYNAYTRKACIDCKKKPGNLELAADVPDNELCRACKIVQEMKEAEANREKKNQINKMRDELTRWYKENLPVIKVGKIEMKRFEVATPEEKVLTVINRKFYEETISKYKDSPDYPYRLKLARQAHLLFPKAKYIRDEESRDHKDALVFKVYEYKIDDWIIEFKCKVNNDGYFLHYMRLLKE